MSVYLARLARFSVRHRRWVVAAWLLIVAGVIILAQISGGKTVDDFSVPGTQAQKATDQLKTRLPAFSGASTQVVYTTHGGSISDTSAKTAVKKSLTQLRSTPQVASVPDPYTGNNVSKDGTTVIVQLQYKVDSKDVKDSTLDAVKKAGDSAESAGVQTEFGGTIYPGSTVTPSELPEIVGLSLGFLIMLITFGAVISAGIPLITAVTGVVIGLMGITAFAAVATVASASTSTAVMLALACGLDYALFILIRHRNNLVLGMSVEDSVALAAGTAGSSVVFAASTVIIALCGLSVVGIPFLTIMGVAAAASVLVALLVVLTLLPAILGFTGLKITKFFRSPTPEGDRTRMAAEIAVKQPHLTLGARWARFVVRHKVPLIVVSVLGMLVIAIPTLSIQLGLPTGENKPASSTAHKAYDIVTDKFGAGANGPLQVVVDLDHAKSGAAATVSSTLAKEKGVASSVVAITQGKTALVQVTPTTGPNDTKTADLVKQIRRDAPALEKQTDTTLLVGGQTATNIDTSSKLSSALPIFLIVVIALAFILLTFAFRTILVPIKSIAGFLLSALAAFGAQVAIFQWGWFHSFLNVQPGETLSFLPILILAIVFGLSSDYEVFVVSRIKEDFTRTGDAVGAVERGTGQAARVVTAAALIMCSVFAGFFLFNSDSTVKAIGFSLGVGVFLDAFVVRLILVPAVMALVKEKFWYHPRWFAKYIPDLDIEGEKLEHLLHVENLLPDLEPPAPQLLG